MGVVRRWAKKGGGVEQGQIQDFAEKGEVCPGYCYVGLKCGAFEHMRNVFSPLLMKFWGFPAEGRS